MVIEKANKRRCSYERYLTVYQVIKCIYHNNLDYRKHFSSRQRLANVTGKGAESATAERER